MQSFCALGRLVTRPTCTKSTDKWHLCESAVSNMANDVKLSTQEAKPKKKREMKSAMVDHSYHDYSNHPFQRNDCPMISTASSRRKSRDRKAPNFPAKLHQILSTPEYEQIIAWLPHGRSWAVINKELLVSVVLKDHFSHNNFESFNRQINIWGFKVRSYSNKPCGFNCAERKLNPLRYRLLNSKRLLRTGPDYKSYYHEAFLRDRPDLIHLIQRLQNEGKRIPNINAEPNFYDMPFLPSRQAPHSDGMRSLIARVSTDVLAQGCASNDSTIRERAGSNLPFKQFAMASSSLQHFPGSTTHFQESTSRFSQAKPTILSSFLTGSGTSNQVPDKTRDLTDTSYKLNSVYRPHGDQESFQLTEAAKHNVRPSTCSPMDSTYQLPSAIDTHECLPYGKGISDCNQWNVKSDTSRRITSYSSGNITSGGSTAAPSLSGQDTDDFDIGAISHSIFPNVPCDSTCNSAEPYQYEEQQAKSIHQNVPLTQQSIALLSNPPKDPLLAEFAKEYLPHFGDMEEDS